MNQKQLSTIDAMKRAAEELVQLQRALSGLPHIGFNVRPSVITGLNEAIFREEAQTVAPCPTCGESEPYTGSCGASDSDVHALCKRKPIGERAAMIDMLHTGLFMTQATYNKIADMLAADAAELADADRSIDELKALIGRLAADAQQGDKPKWCGWNGCGKTGAAGTYHDCAYPDCVAQQVAVPQGWKMVPVEPTHEMVIASRDVAMAYQNYKAMLAAAPQPPQADASPQRQLMTDEEIRDWWASENGLEDCDMCKQDDFAKVVRAVEARQGIVAQPKVEHYSDCAMHNMPAYPNGPCDCGAQAAPEQEPTTAMMYKISQTRMVYRDYMDVQAAIDYLEALIAADMPIAPKAQPADSDPNAEWLTTAHLICAEAGIAPGHISERLRILRDRLSEAASTETPVHWIDYRAMEIARQFTEPREGQRRAQLQSCITAAMQQAAKTQPAIKDELTDGESQRPILENRDV